MLFFHRGHTRMSTILFFTSDRFAFANLSPSATTEKIILTPDPVDGSRLFIGNSTMISYDARCNISTFDGSRATMTIDTLNNRVGIGISSPTVALDIVDAGGVRIVGPTNITGATTFTGNSRVIGVATATSFTGSGIGLTSIPAARIVGSLPAAVYANATIPVAALSGYDNGSLLLSGQLATDSINVSTITAQEASFSSLSSGNAGIDTLSVRSFSTAFGFVSTLTIGRLLAGSISSGSIGSLVTDSGSFNLVTAGTAGINVLNTALLSTGAGTASSFTVGILYAATISSGSLISLSSALVSVSNTGVANSANITTVSNSGVTNATNITTVSNAVTTNTTNITTVSNTVNYLLAVSNISALTISTSSGFFSTISAGTVFGRFAGDGSLLTNLPVTTALAVSNISAVTMSTSFGFFSTISAGTVFGRFVGDGSLLTNLPVTTALATVSNNLTTVSNSGVTNATNITTVSNTVNYLLAVSNISAVTMSTSFGFFSTISAGTVFGRFVGDGSLLTNLPVTTALATVSNNLTVVSNAETSNTTNITTVSNTANYLLAVSNISAVTMSTSFGFFSTISAGTVFGRFVGDGSLLTNLPVTTALATVSNNLTTVSNAGTSNTSNITTVSNTVNYLLAVSNISAVRMSTSFGFFSTISAGTIFGRFVGDGSGLTGISGGGGISIVPPILSTTLLSTGILTASNISTVVISTNAGFASSFYINRLTTSTVTALLGSFSSLSVGQAYISSLTVDSLFIGNDIRFTNMGDIIATSLSTILVTTANLVAVNISATIISTNYGFFSTISAGTIYARFVGDGSALTGIASGGISIVPPVLSTTFLSTGFLSARNISSLTMSTNYGFFSTISAGTVFGRFAGDGSLLTNLPVTAALTTVSNTVNYLLAVSNISAVTMSTSFGFFSTISAGTVFGRFVGDGSLLTNLPVTTVLATVSNNLTTVSNAGVSNTTNITTVSNTVNYLLAVSNISAVTMSTSFGFFSTISAGTVFGRFVGDGSLLTNLPVTSALITVSNTGVTNTTNITTVSNTVNYLLVVSNISAVTMSTSFGFFSTISTGTVFGRFVGDGSLLTGIVGGSGGMSFVPPVLSTTLLSTGDLTASIINTDILNTRLFSTASGSASTFTIGTLFAGMISSASIGLVLTAAGAFSSISVGTANIDILNTRLLSTASGTASSFTIGSIFGSSGSISSIIGNEAKISTVTANTLSSYIVYASSINTPNIYVTNIYANDGGIANVVASSLNASRAVFVQVIASSFQGSLIGKNLLTVETY